MLGGTHTALKEVRMARGSRVRIASDDGPLTAHLDGELRSPGSDVLDVSLVPGALPVLVADRKGTPA